MSPRALVVAAASFGAAARLRKTSSGNLLAVYAELRERLMRHGISLDALEAAPGSRYAQAQLYGALAEMAGAGFDSTLLASAFLLSLAVDHESPELGELVGLDASEVSTAFSQLPNDIWDNIPAGSPGRRPALDWGANTDHDGDADAYGGHGRDVYEWDDISEVVGEDNPDNEPGELWLSDPGLLGGRGDLSGEADIPPDPAFVAADTPTRWINVAVEDMEPTDILPFDQTVTLAFDVDLTARQDALVASRLADVRLFRDGLDEVILTVQLDTDDFEVTEHSRPLRLPRSGRSRGKARFDITPRHEGRCFLTATVHHEGNFVQKLDIGLSVGAVPMAATITAMGRPPSAAANLLARDLTLVIDPAPGAGYNCTVIRATGFGRIHFPITANGLADAVNAARQGLLSVIGMVDDAGEFVFQNALHIPQRQRESALRVLARAGATLFRKLFGPSDSDADLRDLGDYLRDAARRADTRLRLQVVAKEFPVPWGLLYLGDVSKQDTLSWDDFLGLSNYVELLPLQSMGTEPSREIVSDQPSLAVVTAMNGAIDKTMRIDAVARQEQFWADASIGRRLRRSRSDKCAEVVRALEGAEPVHILYFYCHATAPRAGVPGGLDAASLGLVDASITLGDLYLDAPIDVSLAGSPLVFINACESVDMSPLFYEGFVPYFLGKGARGVIGTECKTPAIFAAAWAKRFFERFFAGEDLGAAVLTARREFLRDHGNPLGLVYGVHCDGDTFINPAVLAEGGSEAHQ